VLHRAAYAALGLDWSYDAHEVDGPGLPGFLDGLPPQWRGLSLTMPLKRAVLPLLDDQSETVRRAGAANTVVLHDGLRSGHNTDVPGVSAALRERYHGPVDRAVVLGGGATAASALLGLADLGCREATLLVRDEARAAETVAAAARHPQDVSVDVRRIGEEVPRADVLVSTIPAAAQSAGVLALVDNATAVFEVLYDPWPTPLARATEAAGQVLVSGLDLLVHQAVRQVELMTGLAGAPLEVMRDAGRRALAARG
jgi:shikimate dehydrogenase